MKEFAAIRRGEFGLARHRYETHDATVDAGLKKTQLTDRRLWVNVAPSLTVGDEIRVRASDDSFVGRLYVMFVSGSDTRMKLMDYTQLEKIDFDSLADAAGGYEVKHKGNRKYAIVNSNTGEVVQQDIPSKLDAQKALSDYLRALAA